MTRQVRLLTLSALMCALIIVSTLWLKFTIPGTDVMFSSQVFFVLLWLGRQLWVRRGEIALSYLMLYSMGRVVVEGFRTDSLMLGPLRMAQVMSLVLFFGALLVLLYRRKTGKAEQRKIPAKDRLSH